jgi:hypothetical protein
MVIKPADLILVRGSGLIAGAIAGITHSLYSHVAIVVKENELFEAQGFRPVGYQSLDFYAGCADVYTCDELTDEDRAAIVATILTYKDRHYSYPLLAWEFMRYTVGPIIMPVYDWQPIICSTLAATGYRQSRFDLWPRTRWPTPGDIPLTQRLRYAGSY